MKKRFLIILLLFALAGGAGTGFWYYKTHVASNSSAENAVFVDNVGSILGITSLDGVYNRFSGVVEPQKTESIELASGLKVKTNFVSVGDEVQVGDKLFEYDTDDAQDSITQLEIDIENEDISIESAKNQITELTKLKEKAAQSEQLSYTTQIMTTENSIKRYEYEKKSKQAEMESLKRQIANATVYSEFQGIIKKINTSLSGSDSSDFGSSDDDGSNNAYMTIMATGDYRIKGTVNEQNMSQVREGTAVLVYSRVDESLFWRGEIASIDKEHPVTNSNNIYGSDDSMGSSSTYPFYIDLESSEGLMLGQHVFIVQDVGQEETSGMWLDDYYFIPDENGDPTEYVWVSNDKDQLEKRKLTIGEYDEDLMSYEVLDGLTADDYIAFPDDSYEEGMPTTKNADVDYSASDDEYLDLGDEYDFADEYDFGDEEIGEEEFSDEDVFDMGEYDDTIEEEFGDEAFYSEDEDEDAGTSSFTAMSNDEEDGEADSFIDDGDMEIEEFK